MRFEVAPTGGAPEDRAPKTDGGRFGPGVDGGRLAPSPRGPASGGRFTVRGRRGLNRLRFSGRVRGRALAAGAYVLSAVAVDRGGRKSATRAIRFRIGRVEED